jgi:hypothetical protein
MIVIQFFRCNVSMHQCIKRYLDDTHLLTQFFSMYIITNCYQLVTDEAI